jgi:CheY-like chemotaxis protein
MTSSGHQTLRVLVVDDTPDIRLMVPFQLKMDGLTFGEAASGEEALARCAAEQYDLLVLDYRMPGLSGLEVARKLCDDQYSAEIIMYSAYVDDELQAAAQELGIPVVDKADSGGLRTVVQSKFGLVPA